MGKKDLPWNLGNKLYDHSKVSEHDLQGPWYSSSLICVFLDAVSAEHLAIPTSRGFLALHLCTLALLVWNVPNAPPPSPGFQFVFQKELACEDTSWRSGSSSAKQCCDLGIIIPILRHGKPRYRLEKHLATRDRARRGWPGI